MEKNILTKNQLLVLKKVAENKFIRENFYLTGGTALAGFYLHHRISEDLDFFTEKEFDVSAITVFFQKHKKQLGVLKMDYQQSYNRNLFFLHLPTEVLKTEFTYFPFPRIDETVVENGVKIDSVLDIAVNKLFTIYQRTAARDYIDLYCIMRKYPWDMQELIRKAKTKFDWHIDPLQLGTQFIKAETVSDFPKMIQDIAVSEWQNFFMQEARKLKDRIVK